MMDEKKLNHESFVTGHNGSTPVDVILAILPIVPGSFLASSFSNRSNRSIKNFCIEYILCILPLTLSFTCLSEVNLEFSAALFFLLYARISYLHKFPYHRQNEFKKDKKISYLTSSRATVSIATIIAILAVDFHAFPRRFAKTEMFGYSLMDVGAACYLFMNGITDLRKKILTSHSIKDVLILLFLGLLRLISLKKTNYQEHISEYGVHCNFFFTLAAVKILSLGGISRVSPKRRIAFSICLAILHELALWSGFQEWALSEGERNGILEANREWFVSLPGNFLIYLIGLCVGEIILEQRSPSSDNLMKLYGPFLPFLILFIMENVFHISPSRRIANLSFVSWIVGFFLLFLTLFRILESLFNETSCRIFKSVNDHSLIFFLVGNLLTGAINLCINTLEIGTINAIFVINIYCFILCLLAYLLYNRKVKLKDK